MAFNVQGRYVRSYDWTDDRDANINILASRMDTEFDGIADAINAIIEQTKFFKGNIRAPYGSHVEPGYSFESEPGTGMYRSGSNKLAFTLGTNKYFEIAETGVTFNDNKVWHEGNDGEGSGLNADTLQGLTPTQLQSGVASIPAGEILAKLLTVDGAGSGLDADYLDGLTPQQVANLAASTASSGLSAGDILTKLLTVDGAGSGLNADLLDGTEGNAFVTDTELATALEQLSAGGAGTRKVAASETVSTSSFLGTTFGDVATTTITPNTASSKILVIANAQVHIADNSTAASAAISYKIVQDSTDIFTGITEHILRGATNSSSASFSATRLLDAGSKAARTYKLQGQSSTNSRVSTKAEIVAFELPESVAAGGDTYDVNINRTGGSAETATSILNKLLTVDGAGSSLDTDFFRGQTPEQLIASVPSASASNILSKLLTVDGEGSGLNADLLRGQTPAQIYNGIPSSTILNKLKTTDGKGSGLDADLLQGQTLAQITGSTAGVSGLATRVDQISVQEGLFYRVPTDALTVALKRVVDDANSGIASLKHLTREIIDTVTTAEWEDSPVGDIYAIAADAGNLQVLNNTNFNGRGPSVTVANSPTQTEAYVRLPLELDRGLYDLEVSIDGDVFNYGGNSWHRSFDHVASDVYQYWLAGELIGNYEGAVLKLRRRSVASDTTSYTGSLSGEAKKQLDALAADTNLAIEQLQHLTRDIHDHEDYGEWETASDSDGDLLQVDISQRMPTLTDALFDGNGSSLSVPGTQNELTQIYIRIKKGVNRNTLRVVLDKDRSYARSFPGNQWFSEHFQKPTSAVYDYFEVDGFQNGAGTTAELQKRDATSDTTSYAGTVDETNVVLKDRDTEPDVDDFEIGDILVVKGGYQKVAITDETEPNVFTGTVGSEIIRTTGGRQIRGIIGQYHPNGWTNDGEFTANPDGISEFIIADNERRLQWAIKQTEFEEVKGSAFAEADKLAVKASFPDSGESADETVGAHYNTFSANVNGADTRFIIFSHRKSVGDGNYNLFAESAGNNVKIEYFTVDGNGDATAVPFFTHVVSLKHTIPFIPNNSQQLSHRIEENATTIQALRANIQRDIDSIVGLAEGAAFVTALPNPDTYSAGTKVILTEDVNVTVGSKTEVKYGQGIYGLADKPADAGTSTKKWMSFIVGSGPDYRGFAEGFAGVSSDPLGDSRPQYAYPPDVGNAVVSPLGDAIASFREHRGLVSSYDVAILTIKKSVYYELLQEIHGSAFGSSTAPSITNEHFVVRMVRTDTNAVITNAGEVYWFSRQALSSLGDTVVIAGVEYYQLYYSGDTDFFGGMPDGTTCLLTLEQRNATSKHTFDTTVNKAWSRLDRHDPVTNELAKLSGKLTTLEARVATLESG